MARFSKGDTGTVDLKTSPSALFNNLSCNGHYCTFVKGNNVYRFFEGATNGTMEPNCTDIALKDDSDVTQARWCFVDGRFYLVTSSSNGIHIFRDDAKTVEYVFPLKSSEIEFGDDSEGAQFTRGITHIAKTNQICVGASTGHIFTFDVSSSEGINLSETKACHKYPICALGNIESTLISSDDYGNVVLWDADDDYVEYCRFGGHGYPCSGVAGRDNFVIAAYVTGHVRVFSIREKSLHTEISGHCRAITGLDLHPALNVFATVGEDSILNVWELPSAENENQVTICMSTCCTDSYFTGVSFSQNGTGNLLTNSYDQGTIKYWMGNL